MPLRCKCFLYPPPRPINGQSINSIFIANSSLNYNDYCISGSFWKQPDRYYEPRLNICPFFNIPRPKHGKKEPTMGKSSCRILICVSFYLLCPFLLPSKRIGALKNAHILENQRLGILGSYEITVLQHEQQTLTDSHLK